MNWELEHPFATLNVNKREFGKSVDDPCSGFAKQNAGEKLKLNRANTIQFWFRFEIEKRI